jgi:hypothetical protein
MSGQAAGNVFNRFGNRKFQTNHESADIEPPPPQPQEAVLPDAPMVEANKATYQAMQLDRSKSQTRLRLHYADGLKVRMLAYAYLIEVVSTSHQWLSLVFTSSIVTLKGRNLDALIENLQDEKVRGLVCFHPGRHQPPASNEPCILEIIDLSLHEAADEKKN